MRRGAWQWHDLYIVSAQHLRHPPEGFLGVLHGRRAKYVCQLEGRLNLHGHGPIKAVHDHLSEHTFGCGDVLRGEATPIPLEGARRRAQTLVEVPPEVL